METRALPPVPEMLAAFERRDAAYEGVFVTGVRSTGIFCRPTCPARKPKRENLEFFRDTNEAMFAGFRACKRCRPLRPLGREPSWLSPLLHAVERDPQRRLRDRDLRALGMDPGRVRRWFRRVHGMTFHAYQRARRLADALDAIRAGRRVSAAAFDHGFESLSGFGDAVERMTGRSPTGASERSLLRSRRILTPLGPMVAAADDEGLRLLEFADRRGLERQVEATASKLRAVIAPGGHPHLDALEAELAGYFDGELRVFTVPCVPAGTPFQQSVWQALRTIPYGETRSYGDQARAIGRPAAVRAVARANGANPVAILVPCHRVVGSDGSLTGYGGGLARKRALLDLETQLRLV